MRDKIYSTNKNIVGWFVLGTKKYVLVFGKPGFGKSIIIYAIAIEQNQKDQKIFYSTC